MPANEMRRASNLWTRLKIPRLQAAPAPMQAPPAQTCFEYARSGAAIHLESRSPETLPRAAIRERFPQRLVPALLATANGAARERRSPLKKFSLRMEVLTHRLVPQRRLRCWFASRAQQQKRGYIQGWSLAPRAFSTLPSPRPVLLQFQECARPIPRRTKATELLASESCCAKMMKRRTSSRTDSQKHVHSAAQQKTSPRACKRTSDFSECDYRRPARNLDNALPHLSIGPIRRSDAANWSALYAEGFSSCRNSSLMAARTSSALVGFASLLYAM